MSAPQGRSEPWRHTAQKWSRLPVSVLASWAGPEWSSSVALDRDVCRAIVSSWQSSCATNSALASLAVVCSWSHRIIQGLSIQDGSFLLPRGGDYQRSQLAMAARHCLPSRTSPSRHASPCLGFGVFSALLYQGFDCAGGAEDGVHAERSSERPCLASSRRVELADAPCTGH